MKIKVKVSKMTTNEDLEKLINKSEDKISRLLEEKRKMNIVIHEIPDSNTLDYKLRSTVIDKLQPYFEPN